MIAPADANLDFDTMAFAAPTRSRPTGVSMVNASAVTSV